jgi:hypothetical protein
LIDSGWDEMETAQKVTLLTVGVSIMQSYFDTTKNSVIEEVETVPPIIGRKSRKGKKD